MRIGERAARRSDWEKFLDVVRRADLALPVVGLLRYSETSSPCRYGTGHRGLATAADRIDSVTILAAIEGMARPAGASGHVAQVQWRSRVTSPAGCSCGGQVLAHDAWVHGTGPVAAEYPLRPVRFLIRSMRRRNDHPSPVIDRSGRDARGRLA